MDIGKLVFEARKELEKDMRKIERFSLTPEAFEMLQRYHIKVFGKTATKNPELMGYPVSVNPYQTKPVVALQEPVEEWLHGRDKQ